MPGDHYSAWYGVHGYYYWMNGNQQVNKMLLSQRTITKISFKIVHKCIFRISQEEQKAGIRSQGRVSHVRHIKEVPITQPLTKPRSPVCRLLELTVAQAFSFGGEQMGKTIITIEAIHFWIFLSLSVFQCNSFHLPSLQNLQNKCCCIIFQYLVKNNLLMMICGKSLVLYVTCIRKI